MPDYFDVKTLDQGQIHEHFREIIWRHYVFKYRSCIFWKAQQTKICYTGRTYTNALERQQLILVYLHNKSSSYKSSRHLSGGRLSKVKQSLPSLLFQDFDLKKLRDKATPFSNSHLIEQEQRPRLMLYTSFFKAHRHIVNGWAGYSAI